MGVQSVVELHNSGMRSALDLKDLLKEDYVYFVMSTFSFLFFFFFTFEINTHLIIL